MSDYPLDCSSCGGCTSPGCKMCDDLCTCPASVQQAARTAFVEGQQRAGFGVTAAGTNPHRVGADVQGSVPRVTMTPTIRVKLPEVAPQAKAAPSTLAEQVGALMPYMQNALASALYNGTATQDTEDSILRLAGQRIVTGHAEHGSSLFTMSDDDLARNLAEEFADAVVYRAEQLRRAAS